MTGAALILAAAAGLAAPPAVKVKTEVVEYTFGDTKLKGFFAVDAAATGKRPGVLVVHEWWGLNDYAKKRATMLAELGYAAFCVDMYGDGRTTEHPKEAGEFAGEVRKNVKTWLGRGEAGLKVLAARPEVDATKLGAVGYCFGGTTALQLAFAGNDLKAVAAFHAGLPAVNDEMAKKVKGTILVCHGGADAFIPEESIKKFRATLDAAQTPYIFESYPGVTHSFTVEGIEKKMPMLKYDADADKKSWQSMQEQFKKAFAAK